MPNRAALIRALERAPILRDAYAKLLRHPTDDRAQAEFHAELQRHPEVLRIWNGYHDQQTA